MEKTQTVFASALTILLVINIIPLSYAQKTGPYSLWYDYCIEGSKYPGGTIYFTFKAINSGSYEISVDQIILRTPWKMYTDHNLPIRLSQGESYVGTFEITIPSDQKIGKVEMIFEASARYWDRCSWVPFNPIAKSFTVEIIPNPFILQNQLKQVQFQLEQSKSTLGAVALFASFLFILVIVLVIVTLRKKKSQ